MQGGSGHGQVAGYALGVPLGRGGMGVVFRARRAEGPEVALKVLAGAAPEVALRLVREAEALATLDHPRIVRVLEAGVEGGRPWLALELVPGASLAERLRREGPLPPREAAALVAAVARAVEHAHGRGVLHRDLKASNVLLAADGPRLADFGLARVLRGDLPAVPRLTATGEVVGTPGMMAPEQAAADRGAEGPWTDVHGLGALLHEALTGRPPFSGPSALDALRAVLEAPATPPLGVAARDDVARAVDAVCLACLAKPPAARPPSAGAVARALELAARGEGRAALALAGGRAGGGTGRRRAARRAAAALGAVAGAAALGWSLTPGGTPGAPSATTADAPPARGPGERGEQVAPEVDPLAALPEGGAGALWTARVARGAGGPALLAALAARVEATRDPGEPAREARRWRLVALHALARASYEGPFAPDVALALERARLGVTGANASAAPPEDVAGVHAARALVHLLRDEPWTALAAATAAAAAPAAGAPERLVSSAAYAALGRHEDAELHVERALQLAPEDPDALELRAAAELAAGRPAGAAALLERACAAAPGDPRPRVALARLRLDAGDAAGAAAALEVVAELEDPDALALQAELRGRPGRLEPTASASPRPGSRPRSLVRAAVARAPLLLAARRRDEAIRVLRAASEASRAPEVARDASALLALADRLRELGDLERAGALVAAAGRADPRSPDVLARQAADGLRAGRAGAAREALVLLLEVAPGDANAWTELARLAARAGEPGLELEASERARALGAAGDAAGLALLRLARGDPHGARALADELEDPAARAATLALALVELGRLDEAFAALGSPDLAAAVRRAEAPPDLLGAVALAAARASRLRGAPAAADDAARAALRGALGPALAGALALERTLAALDAGDLDGAARAARGLPPGLAAEATAALALARGRLDEALAATALALEPGGRERAPLLLLRARALAAAGDHEPAVDLLAGAHALLGGEHPAWTRALELAYPLLPAGPPDEEAPSGSADAALRRGLALALRGAEEASDALRLAAERAEAPERAAAALAWAATAALQLDRVDEAARLAEDAVTRDRASGRAWGALLAVRRRQGDADGASAVLARAAGARGHLARISLERARAVQARGAPREQVLAAFEQARAQAPFELAATLPWAALTAVVRGPVAGQLALSRALEQAPERHDVRAERAWFRGLAGDPAGALADARRASSALAREADARAGDAGALTGDAGALTGDAGALAGDAGALAGEAGALAGDAGALAGDAGALARVAEAAALTGLGRPAEAGRVLDGLSAALSGAGLGPAGASPQLGRRALAVLRAKGRRRDAAQLGARLAASADPRARAAGALALFEAAALVPGAGDEAHRVARALNATPGAGPEAIALAATAALLAGQPDAAAGLLARAAGNAGGPAPLARWLGLVLAWRGGASLEETQGPLAALEGCDDLAFASWARAARLELERARSRPPGG